MERKMCKDKLSGGGKFGGKFCVFNLKITSFAGGNYFNFF